MNGPQDTESTAALPDPADRPEADVVIYDGECRFCTAQVRRLAHWDKRGILAFLSLHDPRVAESYPGLTREMLMEQMYVVNPQGAQWAGAAAFRYLSRRLPRLWILVPLLYVPFSLPLWQWAYRQVARHRYWFGHLPECESGSCALHSHDSRRPERTDTIE